MTINYQIYNCHEQQRQQQRPIVVTSGKLQTLHLPILFPELQKNKPDYVQDMQLLSMCAAAVLVD